MVGGHDFLDGAFEFEWIDLIPFFDIGTEYLVHHSCNVSSCYVVPCDARSRGDIGMVVRNEKGDDCCV